MRAKTNLVFSFFYCSAGYVSYLENKINTQEEAVAQLKKEIAELKEERSELVQECRENERKMKALEWDKTFPKGRGRRKK